jgi:hypothetical protein
MARASKIRDRASVPDKVIEELYELYRAEWGDEDDFEWAPSAMFDLGQPDWETLEAELRAPPDPLTPMRLSLREREMLTDALAWLDAHAPRTEHADRVVAAEATRGGVEVPYVFVESAVRLHVTEGTGRRTLQTRIPGLGEWAARVILLWYRAGKPAGLWLDDNEQLRWGPAITPIWDREQREQAIAPTPIALRFPRP